jgi:hypothetical protein
LYTFSELLYVSVFKVSSVKEELFIVVSLSWIALFKIL